MNILCETVEEYKQFLELKKQGNISDWDICILSSCVWNYLLQPERSKREDALISEIHNPELAEIMKPLKDKYDNAMRCSELYGNIERDK